MTAVHHDAPRRRALELADYDETIFIRWNDAYRHDRFTAFEVIMALDASAGLVTVAARRLACSAGTIRNYINRHSSVRLALSTIRAELCDFAMGKILELIKAGNLSVVIWYLNRFGESRGYGRARTAPKPAKQIEMAPIPWEQLNLPPEQLRAIRAAVVEARSPL